MQQQSTPAICSNDTIGEGSLTVHQAPGDYPGGKKGDVLMVEFTAPPVE